MTEKWEITKRISNKKRTGINEKVLSNKNQKGYFKHSTEESKRFSGSVAANEYIAYQVGKWLSLPMAELTLTTINDQPGIVSLVKETENRLYNWKQYSKKVTHPFERLNQSEDILTLFLFDCLIVNIDRNNRNIILYESKRGGFDYYLIDHGLSTFGAFIWKRKKPHASYWYNIARYNKRYLLGLPDYLLKNQEALRDKAKEIQKRPTKRLKKIISQIPDELVSDSEKEQLKAFLLERKELLPLLIDHWILEFKRKEKEEMSKL
jgi:hypothetical protein